MSYMRDRARVIFISNLFRYGLIGGVSATIDLIVFLFLYNALDVNPLVSTTISTIIGITNSFFMNAYMNFKKRDKLLKRYVLFSSVGIFGLVLSGLIIYILHDIFKYDANLAKILSIPLVVLVQYFLNRRFSFSDNPDEDYRTIGKIISLHYKIVLLILLSAFFFFSAVYMNIARDDLDNMLGGKLILEGILPYTGFFTHHAPGMYFLSALIHPFTQNDPFVYRVIFNVLAFIILLVTFFKLKKVTSTIVAAFYLVLMSVGHLIALSHIPLGEAVIAQLLPLIVIMTFMRKNDNFSYKQITVLSILLCLIPFMSLAYIFSILPIYLMIVIDLCRQATKGKSWYVLIRGLLLISLPYLVVVLPLVLTGLLSVIYSDLFIFNSEYYAPMVGEQGGGVAKVLTAVVLGSIAQIIVVGTNMFNIEYVPQILLLTGFAFFMHYLWKKNRRIEAALIPLFLVLLNSRTNIFNSPAISTSIDLLKQHAAPYIGVAILAGSVGVVSFIVSKQKYSLKSYVFKMVAIMYIVVIPLMVINTWAGAANAVFIAKTEPNYWTHSRTLPNSNRVTIVNSLASHKDSVWIGPADFSSQLYINAHRATRLSFYMPWLDASPRLRSEFVTSLKNEKPKLIMFSDFRYGAKVYNYSSELKDVLNNDYFQVKDSRLKEYYFSKQDRINIINQLDRLSYDTK